MHVIEVIPLQKGINIESLSYYSAEAYELGAIVTIPVRKKTVPGMVIGTRPVSAAKTALRTATFSLKKLPAQENVPKLPASIIKTARAIQMRIPASLGAILFSLIPPDIRSGARPYPKLPEHTENEQVPPTVLTATQADRYVSYRSQIREAFAHCGSVLYVVPTSAAVEEAKEKLSVGIEKRVITFTSTHTKKQLDKAYEQFEDLSHAALIITTPNYAFLSRHDITHVIIENAGSPHFVSRARPYLDARDSLKAYTQAIGAALLIGDNLPTTEDEVARRNDVYNTLGEPTKRLQIASALTATNPPAPETVFSLLTEELRAAIERTLENRGRVFLYSSRRGLAPIVMCHDCGHIFRCSDSGAPFSLLRTGSGDSEKRWFYSTTSGARIPAADVCPHCNSWRLREQGIGIQQVYDYVVEQFSKPKVVLVDHSTASTHRKAKALVEEFYASKSSILIGSNLVLPYLTKPVDCTGVISYEAMRSVPTWRADETVFQTLLTLRELTNKDVIVQVRTEPDELLQLAKQGAVEKFYDGEISVRQSLNYPPFNTFVLLTFTGTKTQVADIESFINTLLPNQTVQYYNGPLSSPKKTIRYGLLRLPTNESIRPTVHKALMSLPPYIKLEVNPAKIV